MSSAAAPDTGTLLGVWAHPDDDAFLSAALMATARRSGDRVVVATATRGEEGTPDPERWPPERLGALRAREQARSLAALGVTEHRWLGHHDGTLAEVERSSAIAQLSAIIDEVKPDTIVTFGPDGMTGHSDHRTVSAWVTLAWRETGAPSRLWYATLTPSFHRTWGRVNDEVGLWFDGAQPPVTDEADLAAQVVCDETLADLKHAALRAHASQVGGLVQTVGEERFRQWWSVESFVAASSVAHEEVRHASR
ncbi:MAG TPA: PIG-L family deacetylase [Nocardioidaceae bacterium]|nr:PIG-L family deacetylase [Nocardioidaceae bacterium]